MNTLVNNLLCRGKPGKKEEKEVEQMTSAKKLLLSGAEVENLQLAEDFALPQSVLTSMLQLIDQATIRVIFTLKGH